MCGLVSIIANFCQDIDCVIMSSSNSYYALVTSFSYSDAIRLLILVVPLQLCRIRQLNAVHLLINGSELPSPGRVIEKRSVIKAIIIRAVRFGVVGRGQNRHLVPVDRVEAEKEIGRAHV